MGFVGERRQMTVALSTTTLFGELGLYFFGNVGYKDNIII